MRPVTNHPAGHGPKRSACAATRLNRGEVALLRKVRRYVGSMTGDRSTAEALRFLIRDWSSP